MHGLLQGLGEALLGEILDEVPREVLDAVPGEVLVEVLREDLGEGASGFKA
jgi:hypothetical protein